MLGSGSGSTTRYGLVGVGVAYWRNCVTMGFEAANETLPLPNHMGASLFLVDFR